MFSKKGALVILAFCLLVSMVTGCGSTSYKDGVYKAEAPDFNDMGWKDIIEITIRNGKLDNIDWDGISSDPNIPINKRQYSQSGLYGMIQGGARAEWCDQADIAEKYVLTYGIDSFTLDSTGRTDAISGCTIELDQLTELTENCLRQAS
jgi:major membrane immunogen (membrane-anchored lipoprotein)